MYQLNLDANAQAFVLQAVTKYMGGELRVMKDKLPFYLPKEPKSKP
jgi:hypothetical protein